MDIHRGEKNETVVIVLGGKRTPWRPTRWAEGAAITPIDNNRQAVRPKTAGKLFSWNPKTGAIEHFRPVFSVAASR